MEDDEIEVRVVDISFTEEDFTYLFIILIGMLSCAPLVRDEDDDRQYRKIKGLASKVAQLPVNHSPITLALFATL